MLSTAEMEHEKLEKYVKSEPFLKKVKEFQTHVFKHIKITGKKGLEE